MSCLIDKETMGSFKHYNVNLNVLKKLLNHPSQNTGHISKDVMGKPLKSNYKLWAHALCSRWNYSSNSVFKKDTDGDYKKTELHVTI